MSRDDTTSGLVALAILGGWMLACGGSAPASQPTPAPESRTVTAAKLVGEYDANEVSADQSYKGDRWIVTGRIDRIAKDIMDTPYITLESNSSGITSFQAMFEKGDEQSLARLSKGASVKVECTITGKMMNVLGRQCSLR